MVPWPVSRLTAACLSTRSTAFSARTKRRLTFALAPVAGVSCVCGCLPACLDLCLLFRPCSVLLIESFGCAVAVTHSALLCVLPSFLFPSVLFLLPSLPRLVVNPDERPVVLNGRGDVATIVCGYASAHRSGHKKFVSEAKRRGKLQRKREARRRANNASHLVA